MSDYQPKVGDRVMVGEHGPYTVHGVGPDSYVQVHVGDHPYTCRSAFPEWLTPAPAPEPDEPTAPGALAWFGNYLSVKTEPPRDHEGDELDGFDWTIVKADDNPGAIGDRWAWTSAPRPITVILADPAEVEALREERDQWEADYQEAMRQRDELQRRIDKVIAYCGDPGNWGTYEGRRWLITTWLRGDS